MKLRLVLDKPIGGYWDGGLKRQFDFEIDSRVSVGKDKDGEYVRIGCWDANYWFHVAWSGDEKKTLANVKRKMNKSLVRECLKTGNKFQWEYIND